MTHREVVVSSKNCNIKIIVYDSLPKSEYNKPVITIITHTHETILINA